MEHGLILKIMEHKDFPTKWLNWMKLIFNSGTSSVLFNGVPGKVFTVEGVLDRVTLFHLCSLSYQLIFFSLSSILLEVTIF
jgi:hypothetical protein